MKDRGVGDVELFTGEKNKTNFLIFGCAKNNRTHAHENRHRHGQTHRHRRRAHGETHPHWQLINRNLQRFVKSVKGKLTRRFRALELVSQLTNDLKPTTLFYLYC